MTKQEKMADLLGKFGIPSKEIKCYGSQIMITCWSEGAAKKFAGVLSKFAKIRAVRESLDYNKVNTSTRLVPSTHKVWRVWAVIK